LIELFIALQIYWSDADSGRLPSGEKFRLHDVDAPETWKPKCEAERAAGYDAKAAIISHTRGQTVTVTRDYGLDSYGRRVVDLSGPDGDIGAWLVANGHAQVWDYDGGQRKLDWCD